MKPYSKWTFWEKFIYAFSWALFWNEFWRRRKLSKRYDVVDSQGVFHADNVERAIVPLMEMPELNAYWEPHIGSRGMQ